VDFHWKILYHMLGGYKNYGMVVEFHPRETFFVFGNLREEDVNMAWV